MVIPKVVAITGCDTGLGWSLAATTAKEGFIAVAGMYCGVETEAAIALKKLNAHTYPLDVTKQESVNRFRIFVMKLLKENPEYSLHAIVNNAGVMTIGDYECQTPAMIENCININLLGSMKVVSAFLPDLRTTAISNRTRMQPRIINVASHCGMQPLPGFATYCASKAGLMAWSRALRMENLPHGLGVVNYVPGGFAVSSNLLRFQRKQGEAMLDNLNEEQKQFFGKKIETFNTMFHSDTEIKYDSVINEDIIQTFIKALKAESPKELYKVEPWRYMFYYNLMKIPFPEAVTAWIIKLFLRFPENN